MKATKRIIIVTFLFITGFLYNAQIVRGNNPSDMNLTYESDSDTLNVTITHVVTTPSTHFIQSVTVKVNGTTVETQTYTSQPTSNTFLYQYIITANDGATIQVTAVCSISGQIVRSITLGEEPPPEQPTIPGFCFVGIISSLSIVSLVRITKKKIRNE